jgi:hypothetical protein
MDDVTPQVLHLSGTGKDLSLYATGGSSLLDSINRGAVRAQYRSVELSLPIRLSSIGEEARATLQEDHIGLLARNANINDVVISSLSRSARHF